MAQTLLHDFIIHSCLEKQGSRCMTEGMKGEVREPGGFEGGLHIVGHIVRADGSEIL